MTGVPITLVTGATGHLWANLLRPARWTPSGITPAGASDERDAFNPFDEALPCERSKAAMKHECLKAVVEGQDVVVAIFRAIIGPKDLKPSRTGRVVCDVATDRMRASAARDIVQGRLVAMERGRRASATSSARSS